MGCIVMCTECWALLTLATSWLPGVAANPVKRLTGTVISWNPRMIAYENFLTDEEADLLREESENQTYLRTTLIGKDGLFIKGSTITSRIANLPHSHTAYKMRRRIADTSQLPVEFHEPTRVLRYNSSDFFRGHLDAHALSGRFSSTRTATFFVYLNDVAEGGETHFPLAVPVPNASVKEYLKVGPADSHCSHLVGKSTAQKGTETTYIDGYDLLEGRGAMLRPPTNMRGISVRPKKGLAILWHSRRPDGQLDPASQHVGCPVVTVDPHNAEHRFKYSLTTWIHFQPPNFDLLQASSVDRRGAAFLGMDEPRGLPRGAAAIVPSSSQEPEPAKFDNALIGGWMGGKGTELSLLQRARGAETEIPGSRSLDDASRLLDDALARLQASEAKQERIDRQHSLEEQEPLSSTTRESPLERQEDKSWDSFENDLEKYHARHADHAVDRSDHVARLTKAVGLGEKHASHVARFHHRLAPPERHQEEEELPKVTRYQEEDGESPKVAQAHTQGEKSIEDLAAQVEELQRRMTLPQAEELHRQTGFSNSIGEDRESWGRRHAQVDRELDRSEAVRRELAAENEEVRRELDLDGGAPTRQQPPPTPRTDPHRATQQSHTSTPRPHRLRQPRPPLNAGPQAAPPPRKRQPHDAPQPNDEPERGKPQLHKAPQPNDEPEQLSSPPAHRVAPQAASPPHAEPKQHEAQQRRPPLHIVPPHDEGRPHHKSQHVAPQVASPLHAPEAPTASAPPGVVHSEFKEELGSSETLRRELVRESEELRRQLGLDDIAKATPPATHVEAGHAAIAHQADVTLGKQSDSKTHELAAPSRQALHYSQDSHAAMHEMEDSAADIKLKTKHLKEQKKHKEGAATRLHLSHGDFPGLDHLRGHLRDSADAGPSKLYIESRQSPHPSASEAHDGDAEPSMRKLHVENLRPEITAKDVRHIFQRFGALESFEMGNRECWMVFPSNRNAKDALKSMQGFQLEGQDLQIEIQSAPTHNKAPGPLSNKLLAHDEVGRGNSTHNASHRKQHHKAGAGASHHKKAGDHHKQKAGHHKSKTAGHHQARAVGHHTHHSAADAKKAAKASTTVAPRAAPTTTAAAAAASTHKAQVPACVDIAPLGQEKWHDADGPEYDCFFYATDSNCHDYGLRFSNFNMTAREACCACGGGGSPNSTEAKMSRLEAENARLREEIERLNLQAREEIEKLRDEAYQEISKLSQLHALGQEAANKEIEELKTSARGDIKSLQNQADELHKQEAFQLLSQDELMEEDLYLGSGDDWYSSDLRDWMPCPAWHNSTCSVHWGHAPDAWIGLATFEENHTNHTDSNATASTDSQ